MIPELSTIAYQAPFATKQGSRARPLEAWCEGDSEIGVVVNLRGVQWRLNYTEPAFVLTRESDGYTVTPFSFAGATRVSFAFDQAMQPAFAWQDSGNNIRVSQFSGTEYTTRLIGSGVTPLIVLDEVRLTQQANSDLIVSYVRAGNLYARVQREFFDTEILLASAAGNSLVNFGRNTGNRLQWRLIPLTT